MAEATGSQVQGQPVWALWPRRPGCEFRLCYECGFWRSRLTPRGLFPISSALASLKGGRPSPFPQAAERMESNSMSAKVSQTASRVRQALTLLLSLPTSCAKQTRGPGSPLSCSERCSPFKADQIVRPSVGLSRSPALPAYLKVHSSGRGQRPFKM